MVYDEADECVRLDTRLAGQIRRYHTWPIVKDQTIAEHCWQLLRIYLSVVDVPDINMIYHIAFHDIGEHYTGDIPYPVKSKNPILKQELDMLEHRSHCAQLDFWEAFRQTRLLDNDKRFFKLIELVEMAEFGLDQIAFGNNHGFIVADRCLRAVYEGNPSARLAGYVIKRLKLLYRQVPVIYTYNLEGEWWYVDEWKKIHGSEQDSDRRDSLQDAIRALGSSDFAEPRLP